MEKNRGNIVEISIANRQKVLEFNAQGLTAVLQNTFCTNRIQKGELSVAVVNDDEIKEVNTRFLERKNSTDVIAFTYDKDARRMSIDGEIVINAQEAARNSETLYHNAEAELFLYAVHGALHLLGWDDDTAKARDEMNLYAVKILAEHGVEIDDTALLLGE